MARLRSFVLCACVLSVFPHTRAALCSNWDTADTCDGTVDGACNCHWTNGKCDKDTDDCSDSGMGITSMPSTTPKQLGESCGSCLSPNGDCGTCASGLLCACVGSCADPSIADAPSTCTLPKQLGESCGSCNMPEGDCGTCASELLCACVGDCADVSIADAPSTCTMPKRLGESCGSCMMPGGCGTCAIDLMCKCLGGCADPAIADVPSTCVAEACPCGEMCALDSGTGTGVCSDDNKTCASNGVVECSNACMLGDELTQVPNGWSGHDVGQNSCNTCHCNAGVLGCTKMFCNDDSGDAEVKSPCICGETCVMTGMDESGQTGVCQDDGMTCVVSTVAPQCSGTPRNIAGTTQIDAAATSTTSQEAANLPVALAASSAQLQSFQALMICLALLRSTRA